MLGRILQFWDRLKYLYQINPAVMIRRIFHKMISPVYRREIGYVTYNPKIWEREKYVEDRGTECIVLKTPESLQAWKKRISPLTLFRKLERYLADEPGSIVILATRPESGASGKRVIGYHMCQPNVFVAPGIKEKLPINTLFISHTEVFLEYQRQGVNRIVFDKTADFCRENGISSTVGFVSAHNQPSIEASLKAKGLILVAKFESLSVFCGLYRSATSIEEIRKAIEDYDRRSNATSETPT